MSAKRKKHHEEGEISEAWLLPYSDLMTLILAVFIVLFAVSQVDTEKAKAAADSFRGIMIAEGQGIADGPGSQGIMDGSVEPPIFEPGVTNTSTPPPPVEPDDLISEEDLNNLENVKGELETYFQYEGLESVSVAYIDERGLVISLNNSILFDSGSADLKPENMETILEIGKTISNLDNYIRIEGHTDNVPISAGGRYPSNWELSSARASQVIRAFVDELNIPPEKMVAVGCGEFKPVADNDTAENRARNRRVDIIILNTKYNSLEDQIKSVPN